MSEVIAVGDTVYYDAGDERGLVEAVVDRVREDGSADLSYAHKRQDTAEDGQVVMTGVEKAQQGAGTFRWMTTPAKGAAVTSLEGTAAPDPRDGRIAELEAQVAAQGENIAGLEQAVRLALGLEPDATGDEVRAELEALSTAPDDDEVDGDDDDDTPDEDEDEASEPDGDDDEATPPEPEPEQPALVPTARGSRSRK